MKRTIGYFGDSFCAQYEERLGSWPTYMQIIEQELDLKTVHMGENGTGVGDLVLNQFMPLAHNKQLPDISVFFWTNHSRLFHRTKRGLNIRSVADPQGDPIVQAAKDYYTHLWDGDYSLLEYTAIVKHFDRDILTQVAHATQIVHLWCFGEPHDLDPQQAERDFRTGRVYYPHEFTTGREIRPPMMTIALEGSNWSELVARQWANHFDTQAKNERVAGLIIDSLAGPANT